MSKHNFDFSSRQQSLQLQCQWCFSCLCAASITPHTQMLCCEYGSNILPTYIQKVMGRLFRLLTAAGFVRTPRDGSQSNNQRPQRWTRRRERPTLAESKRSNRPFAHWTVLHRSFVSPGSAQSRTEISDEDRESMQNAVTWITLEYQGRPQSVTA